MHRPRRKQPLTAVSHALRDLTCEPHPSPPLSPSFYPTFFSSKLVETANRSRYIVATTPSELEGDQAKGTMVAQGLTLLGYTHLILIIYM